MVMAMKDKIKVMTRAGLMDVPAIKRGRFAVIHATHSGGGYEAIYIKREEHLGTFDTRKTAVKFIELMDATSGELTSDQILLMYDQAHEMTKK